MRLRIAPKLVVLVVVALALVPVWWQRTNASQQPPPQSAFVIRDVRVFDGERATEHRTVVVQDGIVRQVGGSQLAAPRAAVTINGAGRTLLPGLIDAHVHLSENVEADLKQALSLGVTTVIDMWNAGERFDRIKALRSADRPDVADLRTAGIGASAPGGHPSIMGGPPFPTINQAADAPAFVAARISEGSDFLKIIYDDLSVAGMSLPMLDRETLAALISAAHARGKKAVVHVMAEQRAREAIEAQADGLAHLFIGATVSPDFARLVEMHGAFVIPTLGVLHGICGQPNGESVMRDPLLRPYIRADLRRMMSLSLVTAGKVNSCVGTDEALRQLDRAGVPIVAGTDAPTPTQTYGASLHGELELYVAAGLSAPQALAAATSAPAKAFALTDRGRIAPGMRADLVLVDGDPTTNILATRRIAMIWKRGAHVERVKANEN
jgi:imidazolonepropionase-like amidohydrolase